MINVVKCFAGLILLLLHMEKKFIEMHACKIEKTEEGKLMANCSFGAEDTKLVSSIPDDLDVNIEVLDISGYPGDFFMEKNALEKYTKLTEIYMNSNNVNFTDEFFRPVPNLKVLGISEVRFLNPPPKLPDSIISLIANKLTPPLINISHMKNLEYLFFADNGLTNFPSLSRTAPLVTLDLSYNKELIVNVLDIAAYCRLKVLDLSNTKIEETIWRPACCELQFWLSDMNATTYFSCADISHSKVPDNILKCDPATNEEADNRFRECEKQYQSSYFAIEWYINITIVAGIFLTVLFLIYRYYRSRAVRIYRQEGKTTFAEDDDDEGDDDDDDDNDDE